MKVTAGDRLDVAPATQHWLHDPSGQWSETNCYTDIWIQLLHRLGLDPVPALCFVLSTRFEGEQWTFAKPPAEDLYRLYGIRVVELYVWRPLVDHVTEAAARGDLLTIEVDAHWLPDTISTTYHSGHEKTTIVPVELDASQAWMRYLHNAGCYEVAGDDFLALFRRDADNPGLPLPPYTELIALDGLRGGDPDAGLVRELAREHLRRRPPGNPVELMAQRAGQDLSWLQAAGVEAFHLYAFATVRQCGAVAAMAAAVSALLARTDGDNDAGVAFTEVADGAKTVQFLLARAARGRDVDLSGPLEGMMRSWDSAMSALAARYEV